MFIVLLYAETRAEAIIFTFSDNDFLSGASWGEMTIMAEDSDTLNIRYNAAPDSVIPSGAQVTGFGFAFNSTIPNGVTNPANGAIPGDRDDLDWILLNNLNVIPQPANRNEFIPQIDKTDYTFGVTEGNGSNFTPLGISPGQFDVFSINFTGVPDLTTALLTNFVNLTGIRLQSLSSDINRGSLFLAGHVSNGSGEPVPDRPLLRFSALVWLDLGASQQDEGSRKRRNSKQR